MNKISSVESSRLTVTYRPVGELIPDPRNARTHPKRQIDQIRASIEAFGFTNPVLADPEGHIIAGHGRLQATRAMGLAELPVITLSGLSETQKRTLRIADNKIAVNAGWDLEILQLELGELGAIDVDINLTLTGYSTGEIDVILTSAVDPDLALHPTVKPTGLVADAIMDVTRRGDLVLDLFLGSGTTLLAADRTGRRFRGLDIDPAYVDVAIERWSARTGLEPRLEGPAS